LGKNFFLKKRDRKKGKKKKERKKGERGEGKPQTPLSPFFFCVPLRLKKRTDSHFCGEAASRTKNGG
jgi:hypothetical protein